MAFLVIEKYVNVRFWSFWDSFRYFHQKEINAVNIIHYVYILKTSTVLNFLFNYIM